MSEQAPDRLWSGIQISKVIAGTLAAVTAAVLGSFLGVAGTLAGAALASVVGSVGTEIFNNSLKRSTKHLQTVAPTFIKVPAAVGTPPVAAATEEEKPSHTVAEEPGRPIRWGRIGLAALTLFLLSMGALSAFEAITDKPISATVRHTSVTGTTLFGNSGDTTSKDDEKPAPTVSGTPSDEETSTPDPSSSATPGADTPEQTPATTAPTAEPTTEATTQAPQQTPPADQPQQPAQNIAPQQDQGSTTE